MNNSNDFFKDELIFHEDRSSVVIFDTLIILLGWIGFIILLGNASPFKSAHELLNLETNLRAILTYIAANASISLVVIIWALLTSTRTNKRLNQVPSRRKNEQDNSDNLTLSRLKNAMDNKWIRVWHDINGRIQRTESTSILNH